MSLPGLVEAGKEALVQRRRWGILTRQLAVSDVTGCITHIGLASLER